MNTPVFIVIAGCLYAPAAGAAEWNLQGKWQVVSAVPALPQARGHKGTISITPYELQGAPVTDEGVQRSPLPRWCCSTTQILGGHSYPELLLQNGFSGRITNRNGISGGRQKPNTILPSPITCLFTRV